MIENLEFFLKGIREASVLGKDVAKKIKLKKYTKIVFCGIGGSAYPGEVVKSLNLKIPVVLVREILPDFVNEKTLCFIISYSGNTKETIKLYNEARRKKCKIVIITSGGKLGFMSRDKIFVPEGYLPREAFIFLLFPVLNILKINYKGCFEIVEKFNLEDVKKIAIKLKDKIPIIYCSSEELKFLGYRWQTFFNENSKTLAHSNYFPELVHNEIEAVGDDNFKRILLFDKKTKQIKHTNKFLKPIEIKLNGKSLIVKLFYGTYFGFLLSYFLAEIEKVDYKLMPKIDYLKGNKN